MPGVQCTCEAEVHMGVGFYHHPWCATKTQSTGTPQAEADMASTAAAARKES